MNQVKWQEASVTNLERMRRAAGLTQQELERRSGVKQGLISLIERGLTKNPRVDTAAKLARALGCTIDELISPEDKDT